MKTYWICVNCGAWDNKVISYTTKLVAKNALKKLKKMTSGVQLTLTKKPREIVIHTVQDDVSVNFSVNP